MKTSIFDMKLTLPPMVEMTQVEKDMNMAASATVHNKHYCCQETDMKKSIFNMTFTLPPLVEMVEVEKDLPSFRPTDMAFTKLCLIRYCEQKTAKISLSDMRQMLSTGTKQPTAVGYFDNPLENNELDTYFKMVRLVL